MSLARPHPPPLDCKLHHHLKKGAIKTEVKEIVAAPWEYARDKWNVLDVTSLLLMFISLCYGYIRGIHSIEARTMYALSAPLAVSRTLFFAQILPSQGPMIQVISK